MKRAQRLTAPVDRPVFSPGETVRVVAGMSIGATGVVVSRWVNIGDWEMWRVDLPDCRDRAIRGDYLERVKE